MSDNTLRVEGLTTGYDKVNVLHDVSIEVPPGKITCILGANGAGKSTLIRAILGLTPARKGRILWNGADIAAEKTHNIIARGISCIPEGRKVFPRMTVAENLALGAFWRLIRPRCGSASHASTRFFRACASGPRSWPAPCRAVSRPWCRSVAG